LKLTSSTTAAVWQPSQPIYSLGLAVCLGYERLTLWKMVGSIIAISGSVFVVVYGAVSTQTEWTGSVWANFFFVGNCLCMATYVISSKSPLRTHPPIKVIAWSYFVGSICMLISTVVITETPVLLSTVCPDCEPSGGWHIPLSMIWALMYWVIFSSVIAFFLITWANQFVNASQVSLYAVCQPLTTSVSDLFCWLARREEG